MAHSFDTALTSAQRTLVQLGAVQLLSGLLRTAAPVPGYLAAVIPWGGVIRSYTDADGIDLLYSDLVGRAPSIAVALADRSSSSAGVGGFQFKAELDLMLYFASNHARDMTEGRFLIDAVGLAADTADPGLHIMMEHAEELIVGQRCGGSSSIKQVVPVREEELVTTAEMSLWLQHYRVTLVRTINENRSAQQLLTDLRTNVRNSDPAEQPPNNPEIVVDTPIP